MVCAYWTSGAIIRRWLPVIRLDNVTKQYDLPSEKAGQIVAADRLNLHVSAGQIFGMVGPNGAGKTTTLKMICGLQIPTSGQITVNGIDVQSKPEEAQKHIGYLADFFGVYDDMKVYEYLLYFARAYKMDIASIQRRVDEVLALMTLENKRDAFVGGLSRGMKQRLGIGRAIIHNPPLLVLDEPAAGLDPKARVELKELLKQLHRDGKTIFITSHILSDLEEICTSIAIIEKGRLLRVGSLLQVMSEGKTGRRFRIQLAAPGFPLAEFLSGRAGAIGVVAEPSSAQFIYSGSDAELAAIVRELAAAGAPICRVEEHSESLETLYSRISSGDTM